MATTISLPTAHNGGSAMNAILLENGVNSGNPPLSASVVVTFSAFSSLSIPSGATVNGIEVIVNGQGSTSAGRPTIKVGYASTLSSSAPFSGDFSKSNALFDPGWGTSSFLWGLSWTPAQAEAIVVRVGEDYGGSARCYWDFIKVRVTFTAAASATVHSVNTVAEANIASIKGVAHASIGEVNTVTFD
jgi:hypothetical protein